MDIVTRNDCVSGQKPVFLFCSGMRCGSTLLQRMIIGSGETMVWGETGGALDQFSAAWQGYQQMLGPGNQKYPGGLGGNGDDQRRQFESDPSNGSHLWIPCINPDQRALKEAFRSFFESYYYRASKKLGYERWGIKKVRSDLATAKFMYELFPEGKFIFLVREPVACISSIKQHDWMDHPGDSSAIQYYIDQWRRTARSFSMAGFGHKVRYEDLIEKESVRREIYDYLEIKGVSPGFLVNSRPKGRSDSQRKLNAFERLRVLVTTRKERKLFGYP